MSDKVSEELSASAKSLSKSRECFIEIYIDNGCLIVIVKLQKLFNSVGCRSLRLSIARWMDGSPPEEDTRCQRHKTFLSCRR